MCALKIVALTLDTPERSVYCNTTKPGAKFGCWRCNMRENEQLDGSLNPYNHMRSMFHYHKMKNKYPNETRSTFGTKTGYILNQYEQCRINSISNPHSRCTVDINHDVKNKIQQLDSCVKKIYIPKITVNVSSFTSILSFSFFFLLYI